MSKELTAELWARLKDLKTSSGCDCLTAGRRHSCAACPTCTKTQLFLSSGKHETAQLFARGESCEVQMFARGERMHFFKRKCQIILLHADTLSITQSKRASKLHTWAWGSPLATRSHGRFSRTCTIQSSRAGTTMTLKAVCAAEPCQMCDHTTMLASAAIMWCLHIGARDLFSQVTTRPISALTRSSLRQEFSRSLTSACPADHCARDDSDGVYETNI